MKIVPASAADAAAVSALADRLAITALGANARDSGFLVSAYSQDTYAFLAARAPYFLLAFQSNTLIGFALAYPYAMLPLDDDFNRRARNRYLSDQPDDLLVLGKQTAIAPEARRQGVARALYGQIYKMIPESSTMFGAIVEEPKNQASEAFHASLGWRRLGPLANPDGRPRGIWARSTRHFQASVG